jgi:hypothetical protein
LKRLIFRYLFSIVVLAGLLFSKQVAYAQNATFSGVTAGLPSATLTSGQSQVGIVGLKVITDASATFTQFNLGWLGSNVETRLANGTLYRSASASFNAASPGTPVGNVTFSGTKVTVSDLLETVSGTMYYYLVADVIYSSASTDYNAQIVINSSTFATDINSKVYKAEISFARALVFSGGTTPYPIKVAYAPLGLNPSATTLLPAATGVAMFGFGLTASSGTKDISQIYINSNLTTLSQYFSGFTLYTTGTTDTYSAGARTAVPATITMINGYVKAVITGSNLQISTTKKYYWLVADINAAITGPLPAAPKFYISSGQANISFTSSTPAATYNTASVVGPTYNMNGASVTMTATTNLASGAITPFKTDMAVFGFGMSCTSAITVSAINVNSTNTAATYFGNGLLYTCPTSAYNKDSRTLVPGAVVTFNGNYANITGLSLPVSTTVAYYYLVADNIGTAASSTIAFNFQNNQSSSAVIQSGPTASVYNNFTTTGNTLTLPLPTILVTGANDPVINGITAGNLTYGQTNIVLFGFGAKAAGQSFTVASFHVKTSGSENSYFSNGRLYRSTTPTFPGGDYFCNFVIDNGGMMTILIPEGDKRLIPNGTTYYYWVVADYTGVNNQVSTTFTCSFAPSQGQLAIDVLPYSTALNYYNISGRPFPIIATTENWTGTTDNEFAKPGNYIGLNNSSGVTPGAATIVNIANPGTYPTVKTSTSIGGLTFSGNGTPKITIADGQTLTLNTEVNVVNGKTAEISGPGTLALAGTASLKVGALSKLSFTNGLIVTTAGTTTLESTSVVNLTGDAKLTNTGSFTLKSSAAGSATIGALSGASTITGSFNVERFMTGGTISYRGYRLLSSAVSAPAPGTAYYNLSFLKNTGSYLTGAANGGFNAIGTATIYLYRDDKAPSTAFASGNYRPITKIDNAPNSYLIGVGTDGDFNLPVGTGLLYFFRGNAGTLTTTVPSSVVFTQVGNLNQGQIVVKNWVTGSSNLSCTSLPAAEAVKGFNLVGNPYPSSINWNTAYENTSSTTGIYAPNVGNSIYSYSVTSKNYAVYTNTGPGKGIGTNGATNIIAAGQGFFVRAADATAQLIFNESAKVDTPYVVGNKLLLGTPVAERIDQHLRLQLAKDSINKDETIILFNSAANSTYVKNEDALYLKGTGVVSISNMSADSKALAINQIPFPKQNQKIKLNVTATGDGIYSLNLTEVKNIPQLYDVWLMDAYKKDSLDIKHNPTYNFNVITKDTASTSANRFTLVIRQNAAYTYKLLDFNANVVFANVQLAWKTENEANYTYFTVERSTDGGKTFDVLGSEKATSQGLYSLLDKNPVTGENKYRLKQEDINGVVTYSKTISVTYAPATIAVTGNSLSVYPNPASTVVNLVVNKTSDEVSSYRITITSSAGRVLKSALSTQADWQDNVSSFLPGTYFIQVVNEKDKSVIGRSSFIKL